MAKANERLSHLESIYASLPYEWMRLLLEKMRVTEVMSDRESLNWLKTQGFEVGQPGDQTKPFTTISQPLSVLGAKTHWLNFSNETMCYTIDPGVRDELSGIATRYTEKMVQEKAAKEQTEKESVAKEAAIKPTKKPEPVAAGEAVANIRRRQDSEVDPAATK